MKTNMRVSLVALGLCLLNSCGGGGNGGGGGGQGGSTPITSFDLVDPTPGADNLFGLRVVILSSGNIVVTDEGDSSVASKNGAVHLFNPATQTRIASIYGDNASDQLGGGDVKAGVTALANGNFVIVSPHDRVGMRFGSVKLFNGTTGAPIGSTVAVDGFLLGVTALANSNFVTVSPRDSVGGVLSAGSVKLFDGTTGAPIGSTIAGDDPDDWLGSGGVTALANGNFVIVSPDDAVGGVLLAGSVKLFDGTTGAPIGSTVAGDDLDDRLGSGGVTALANGNFVIASPSDNVGGVSDAGSVKLFDGATGAPIGSTVAGDDPGDCLGFGRNIEPTTVDCGFLGGFPSASGGVITLANGNFVIVSPFDNVGGVVDAGSVKLFNGTTGLPIGSTVAGDDANDSLGSGGATALANGNFVIVSPSDNVGGVLNAGSVKLFNGTTGAPIGSTIAGDDLNDQLGAGGVTALADSNFVIVSPLDFVGGVLLAGSVKVFNGTTGAPIGSTIAGQASSDVLVATVAGSATGDFFVLGLSFANKNGLSDSGLVRLIAP